MNDIIHGQVNQIILLNNSTFIDCFINSDNNINSADALSINIDGNVSIFPIQFI